MAQKILLVAGESSGDLHGAGLAEALKVARPSLELIGLGGSQMKAAGVSILADPTRLAVVGLIEVFKHLGDFRELFRQAVEALDQEKPNLVILIDYPGFNLRFAREVHRRGIRLVYYISPQLWAWDPGRIRKIKRWVHRMLVVFPFEKELYEKHQVPVTFVGHPLLDRLRPTANRLETLEQLGLSDGLPIVGLLPGSREGEIRRILPVLLKACEQLQSALPDSARFLLIKSPTLPWSIYQEALAQSAVQPKVVEHWDYDVLKACDLVLVTSGTATLECALLERPMLIVYKSHWLTYLAARLLIRIPRIGLVNVVANAEVVPELIQHKANPKRVAEETLALWKSAQRRDEMRGAFRKIREGLGQSGASQRAAEAVLKELDSD